MKKETMTQRAVLFLFICLFAVAPSVAQDRPFTQVLIPGEDWELVAEGYKFTEGPAVDRQGNVFFVDVVASDGGIYVTDPRGNRIWYISPDRKKRVVATNLRPNGIILTADEGTLVASDGRDPVLWAFRVEKDGSLTYGSPYYQRLRMPRGAKKTGSDGMTVDTDGRLYVATLAGLQMFGPSGWMRGVIRRPQNKKLANVVFGGPGFHYLYATSMDKVYRRKVKPTGVPYFLRAKKKR